MPFEKSCVQLTSSLKGLNLLTYFVQPIKKTRKSELTSKLLVYDESFGGMTFTFLFNFAKNSWQSTLTIVAYLTFVTSLVFIYLKIDL